MTIMEILQLKRKTLACNLVNIERLAMRLFKYLAALEQKILLIDHNIWEIYVQASNEKDHKTMCRQVVTSVLFSFTCSIVLFPRALYLIGRDCLMCKDEYELLLHPKGRKP